MVFGNSLIFYLKRDVLELHSFSRLSVNPQLQASISLTDDLSEQLAPVLKKFTHAKWFLLFADEVSYVLTIPIDENTPKNISSKALLAAAYEHVSVVVPEEIMESDIHLLSTDWETMQLQVMVPVQSTFGVLSKAMQDLGLEMNSFVVQASEQAAVVQDTNPVVGITKVSIRSQSNSSLFTKVFSSTFSMILLLSVIAIVGVGIGMWLVTEYVSKTQNQIVSPIHSPQVTKQEQDTEIEVMKPPFNPSVLSVEVLSLDGSDQTAQAVADTLARAGFASVELQIRENLESSEVNYDELFSSYAYVVFVSPTLDLGEGLEKDSRLEHFFTQVLDSPSIYLNYNLPSSAKSDLLIVVTEYKYRNK